MHIGILVGIDGLGKTPLLNMMATLRPDAEIVSFGNRDYRKMSHTQVMKLASAEVRRWVQITHTLRSPSKFADDKLILLDRFPYPDDFVYRNRNIPANDLLYWDNLLTEFCTVFIYIYPQSIDWYLEHMLTYKNPDEYQPVNDREWVERTLYRYGKVRQYTKCRWKSFVAEPFTAIHARAALEAILS